MAAVIRERDNGTGWVLRHKTVCRGFRIWTYRTALAALRAVRRADQYDSESIEAPVRSRVVWQPRTDAGRLVVRCLERAGAEGS